MSQFFIRWFLICGALLCPKIAQFDVDAKLGEIIKK